jgi:hypothetical protein
MKTSPLLLLVAGVALSSPVLAKKTSCEILGDGEKLYIAGKLSEARSAFLKIYEEDRLGRDACTKSIYAYLGTIHMTWADQDKTTNPAKSLENYRTAALFNRAFANAAMCTANNHDCNWATTFWTDHAKTKELLP